MQDEGRRWERTTHPGVFKREGPGGVRYKVAYRDPAGRQHTKSFRRLRVQGDEEGALDFQRTTLHRVRTREWRDPKDAEVLLGDHLDSWLRGAAHLRQSTRDLYAMRARLQVLPEFAPWPIGAIRPADVREWLQKLADAGAGPRTIQQARQVLGLALETAVADGVLAANAVRHARPPSAPRQELVIPTTSEVRAIAAAIEPRYHAMVLLGAFGGLRFGELAGLQRRDLRLLERKVHVHRQVVETSEGVGVVELKTKASRRSVPIPGFVADAIAEHLLTIVKSDAPDAHVFTTAPRPGRRDGALLRHRNFRPRVWMPALKAAGVGGVRFHDLRHHAASAMIAEGAHPAAIRERMGHSSIQVTFDVYGHLFPAIDEDLGERLEKRWRATESEGDVVPIRG